MMPLTCGLFAFGKMLVRPEQIVIIDPVDGFAPAKAVAIDFRGYDGLVELLVEAGNGDLVVTARSAGQLLPAPGQRVGLRLTGTALGST